MSCCPERKPIFEISSFSISLLVNAMQWRVVNWVRREWPSEWQLNCITSRVLVRRDSSTPFTPWSERTMAVSVIWLAGVGGRGGGESLYSCHSATRRVHIWHSAWLAASQLITHHLLNLLCCYTNLRHGAVVGENYTPCRPLMFTPFCLTMQYDVHVNQYSVLFQSFAWGHHCYAMRATHCAVPRISSFFCTCTYFYVDWKL